MATGKGKDRQVQIVSLPRNLIDAGVKTARAGENPLTGNKPPGTTADLSNARQLPPANGTVPWKVEPDGLPARKLVKQPIPLDGAENPHVFFAGKAAQAAVVSSVASTDRVRGRQLHVNRYDLTNGQSLGGMDLFNVVRQGNGELAGGLDPDGTCLVLVEPQERKRVDVWSLAAGKHAVGFTPYAGDGKVRWAALLDDKRLLTLSTAGKLALWSLPDCKAVYAGDGFLGTATLSAGRKYLVASRARAVWSSRPARAPRAACCRCRPERLASNTVSLAFNADGKALAGIVGGLLVRWDMSKGTLLDSCRAPRPGHMQWCGERHILVHGVLVDLDVKAPVSNYDRPLIRIHYGSPDGRAWFTTSRGATPLN